MGCGKSSVGRKLTSLLTDLCAPGTAEGRVLQVDLDDYIVEREGRSITEIFAQDGESGFRAIESRCLTEVLDWADGKSEACGKLPQRVPDVLVLSLGGGAVLKNVDTIHKRSFCIYLKAKVETLVERLTGNSAKRPLLASEPADRLKKKVEDILNARQALYESAAHITVQTDDLSVYASAQKILDVINSR